MSRAKVNFDLPTGIENLDITVNFTSKPFPVIAVDSYGVQLGLTSIRMRPQILKLVLEGYDPVVSLTGVELKPSPKIIVEPEGYDPVVALTALRLKAVPMIMVVEGYDPVVSLTGLKLKQQPKFAIEPEGYNPTVSLTGIELL